MCDWADNSLKSPLEAYWTAYKLQGAFSLDAVKVAVSSFYRQVFGVDCLPTSSPPFWVNRFLFVVDDLSADSEGRYFDPIMAELLQGTEYGDAYAADLTRTDGQGNTVDIRADLYNPMYYLHDYYDGYQNANVAQYWRIRFQVT